MCVRLLLLVGLVFSLDGSFSFLGLFLWVSGFHASFHGWVCFRCGGSRWGPSCSATGRSAAARPTTSPLTAHRSQPQCGAYCSVAWRAFFTRSLVALSHAGVQLHVFVYPQHHPPPPPPAERRDCLRAARRLDAYSPTGSSLERQWSLTSSPSPSPSLSLSLYLSLSLSLSLGESAIAFLVPNKQQKITRRTHD